MAKNGMPEGPRTTLMWVIGLSVIALTVLITLIIFGNLSGNLGFVVDSTNYNNTQEVITDYTTSATNLSGQFATIGTMIGIALLLTVLIGILVFAVKKLMAAANVSGSSNSSFG